MTDPAAVWHHLYGAVVPDDAPSLAGCTITALVYPSTLEPAAACAAAPTMTSGVGGLELPYLGGWDHKPTAAERNAVHTPGMDDAEDEPLDELDDDEEDGW